MKKGKRQLSPALFPSALKEQQFQRQVIDLARLRGWLVFHVFDSRLALGNGYPDLCLAKLGHNIIYAELKSKHGQLRPEQKVWLEVLATVPGVEVYIWKPENWDDIVAILSR